MEVWVYDFVNKRPRKYWKGQETGCSKNAWKKIDVGIIVKVTGLTEKEFKQVEEDMLVSL